MGYIVSFIYQILIRLIVGRENAGYWATFKIYAYTSVVELLTWVPVLWVIASAYGYYLIFIAVREAHSRHRGGDTYRLICRSLRCRDDLGLIETALL